MAFDLELMRRGGRFVFALENLVDVIFVPLIDQGHVRAVGFQEYENEVLNELLDKHVDQTRDLITVFLAEA